MVDVKNSKTTSNTAEIIIFLTIFRFSETRLHKTIVANINAKAIQTNKLKSGFQVDFDYNAAV